MPGKRIITQKHKGNENVKKDTNIKDMEILRKMSVKK